jgi:peptidylprolyl isomerase/FKBP-type peptidyl-prolyl cis-trans isomerase FklB
MTAPFKGFSMRVLTALGLALALAACGAPKAANSGDLQAANSFMTANAKLPGVVTLPSGLQYKIVTSGPANGPHPRASDEVKVNYEGKLVSGQIFDSSFQRGVPADFPLDGLVQGWVEALQLMRPGDEWILYVPPSLGYGDEDKGPIPANSALIFRIQLLGVLPHPAGAMG